MLRRYQNEAILLLAILLLAAAVLFKVQRQTELQSRVMIGETISSKIEDIATMKKLWKNSKVVTKKLEEMKAELDGTKIKKFILEKKKAHIVLESLSGSQLNKIVGKYIASTPLEISALSIDRIGEKYRLELKCKW